MNYDEIKTKRFCDSESWDRDGRKRRETSEFGTSGMSQGSP